MAATFTILGTVPTVELVGANATRQVRQITARAEPSGTTFSFIVVPADYVASHVNLIAHDIAAALNKDADVPGVVDINVYQDVNGAGQFVNRALVTVESTSGDSTVDIQVPYGAIFDARFAKQVAAARATMDEIEQL